MHRRSLNPRESLSLLTFLCFFGIQFTSAAVDSVVLTPVSCCDGQFSTTNAGGQSVWQNSPGNAYMYFNVPSTFTFTSGVPVFVRIVYFDEGYGTVALQYDATSGSYTRSEIHTRSSRVNTRAFVTNYHQLSSPALLGRQNGSADFRLQMQNGGTVPVSVRSATIQNFAFSDPQFQLVINPPWTHPYTGPTRDDVDRSTLVGKVMAGYQGWFRTPNDYNDQGWGHWVRNGTMDPANFTIDMWPDLTSFGASDLAPAGELRNRSGRPAQLFSSTTPEIVHRHFQWMRKYNIDGAFLQRFVNRNSSGAYGSSEWVLNNVRQAAHLEGRLWAIEYDISALAEADALEVMTNDWRWLVDVVGIRNDSRYAYEGTKPVVFIWGLPFPDRGISKPTANAIVDFFKNDPVYGGNYVIGGVPWWWRTIPDWNDHFQRYNGVLAWMPQNAAGYAADLSQLASWGIDYFPHVWPGFSWGHLQQITGEAQYSPRGHGAFYWQKIYEALGSSPSRLFIGMFDEYDEGTAIMPMADDPPPPAPNWGRFVTNLGKPVDWWMLLTGEAREMLLGNRFYSSVVPTETELANRSNIGPEASADLGASNSGDMLQLLSNDDGNTSAEVFAGRDCRYNSNPLLDHYFYFNVSDTFLNAVSAGADVTIEVEYNDQTGNATLGLQYDSTTGAYSTHPKSFLTRGTGLWRTARFNVADAYFGNRQNAGADFRVTVSGTAATIHIDRVRVTLPDSLVFQPRPVSIVPAGSVWKYFDKGTDQGTAWRALNFDDSTWSSGPAQLGYGEGDEATPVSFGTNSSLRNIATYFRRAFLVSDPGQFVTLVLGIIRDDGAVAYLNGQEIYRGLLPSGTINYNTFATNSVGGSDESAFFEKNVDPSLLIAGTNILAVEIHQPDRTSSDLSFDLILAGVAMTNLPAGVFLTAPTEGAEFLAPTNIPFNAVAAAGNASITRVEFFAGTNKLGEATQTPYRFTWANAPLGSYSLTARATASGGIMMTSAPVTIKVSPFVTTTTLIPRGSFWRYLDDGSNQGTAWRSTNFNDNAWASGRARLGYGNDGEVTPLNFGVSTNKYITYYFRRGFNVSDLSVITNLSYRLLRDDGAVVYLNSNEVYRSNMPGGTLTYLTGAFSSVSGGDEQTFYETNTGPAQLRIGTNTLAVEIHQFDGMSSDVGFDLELVATGPPPPPPRLNASRSGANVRLTWPANATSFQLESAVALDSVTNWTSFPASVGTSNTESVVTTPASGSQRFFRLRK